MKAATAGVKISPVNMEERSNLGIKAGDTVRVHQKIQDKGKTRIQVFEGLVLARKHGNEPGATFTVRKVASGVGVEKIFPLYSPMIDKLEIVRRAKVRKSKLYYIREKVAREVRRQMRRMNMVSIATESGAEAASRIAAEEEEAAKKAEAEIEAEATKANEANVEASTEENSTEAEEVTTSEEKKDEPEVKEEESSETADSKDKVNAEGGEGALGEEQEKKD